MSTESVNNKEQEAPITAVSELASGGTPLTANVPSGALNANTTTNFYFPFLEQTFNATAVGSGNIVWNTSASGWASVNNAGFVFQNGQYNSKREGSGQ